jgi:hypothetical protein
MKKNKSLKYKKQWGGIIPEDIRKWSSGDAPRPQLPGGAQAIVPQLPAAAQAMIQQLPATQKSAPAKFISSMMESFPTSKINPSAVNSTTNAIIDSLKYTKRHDKKVGNRIWWETVIKLLILIISWIGSLIALMVALLPTLAIAGTVIVILELIIITLNIIIIGFYRKVLKPISKIIPMRLKRPKTIPHSWIILWTLIKSIIGIMFPKFARDLNKIKTSNSFINYNSVVKKK